MKLKDLKKKPYHGIDVDGNWRSTDAAHFARGFYFKPSRLLAFPNGALIALMTGLAADEWLIFSVDENGLPARSKIFDGRAAGELAFQELAAKLTEKYKHAIAEQLSSGKLPGKKRTSAVLELARLSLADDDLRQALREEVEQFVATHSAAECEAKFQEELAEYDRTRAAVV